MINRQECDGILHQANTFVRRSNEDERTGISSYGSRDGKPLWRSQADRPIDEQGHIIMDFPSMMQ